MLKRLAHKQKNLANWDRNKRRRRQKKQEQYTKYET